VAKKEKLDLPEDFAKKLVVYANRNMRRWGVCQARGGAPAGSHTVDYWGLCFWSYALSKCSTSPTSAAVPAGPSWRSRCHGCSSTPSLTGSR
jgi:hypothetical protein